MLNMSKKNIPNVHKKIGNSDIGITDSLSAIKKAGL